MFNSVTVDEEIRPDRVTRTVLREDCTLNMYLLSLLFPWCLIALTVPLRLSKFAASEVRFLRVAVSSFLESMHLATTTYAHFSKAS